MNKIQSEQARLQWAKRDRYSLRGGVKPVTRPFVRQTPLPVPDIPARTNWHKVLVMQTLSCQAVGIVWLWQKRSFRGGTVQIPGMFDRDLFTFKLAGFRSCNPRAPLLLLLGSRAQTQQLRLGSVAPRHVGSSRTRDWTRVSCIGRQILYHWATTESLKVFFQR